MTMNPQQQTGTSQESKSTASQVADQARQKTSDMMDQAQQTAKTTVSQQKGRVAESMGTVADALRKTGQNLHDQNQAAFGRVAEQAADRIDQFSDDLQNKSVDEMLYDVQNFARRDPQLFLGGALVLGLFAARFLKASGDRRRQEQMNYSQQYYRSRRPDNFYGRRSYPNYNREGMQSRYSETYTGDDYTGFESNLPAQPNLPATSSTTGNFGARETGNQGTTRDFGAQETGSRGAREFPASGTGSSLPTSRPDRDRDNPSTPGSQRREDK